MHFAEKNLHIFGRNGKIEYAHVIMVSMVIIIIIQGRFIARFISILASAIAGRKCSIQPLKSFAIFRTFRGIGTNHPYVK